VGGGLVSDTQRELRLRPAEARTRLQRSQPRSARLLLPSGGGGGWSFQEQVTEYVEGTDGTPGWIETIQRGQI
jgi:hypothetical protein